MDLLVVFSRSPPPRSTTATGTETAEDDIDAPSEAKGGSFFSDSLADTGRSSMSDMPCGLKKDKWKAYDSRGREDKFLPTEMRGKLSVALEGEEQYRVGSDAGQD